MSISQSTSMHTDADVEVTTEITEYPADKDTPIFWTLEIRSKRLSVEVFFDTWHQLEETVGSLQKQLAELMEPECFAGSENDNKTRQAGRE